MDVEALRAVYIAMIGFLAYITGYRHGRADVRQRGGEVASHAHDEM
jgi:hypothetical protein